MTENIKKALLERYKTIGSRHPKNVFKTLNPSHPYTELLIKRLELDLNFDNYENKDLWFKEYESLNQQIDKLRGGIK